MTQQELLRTRDVAKRLSISERQVRDMAQKGELPAIRVSGEWRFESDALERWIERHRSGPQESENADDH